jgi:hypothetical protein
MVPFSWPRQDRLPVLFLVTVALLLDAACALSAWLHSGGRFMFPLDDSYIHLQYALRAGHGAPFSYAPDTPASGGASSPLWVALLAPAFAIGLSGVKGALAALALGAAVHALAVAWTFQLASRLAGRTGGFAAAALLLANGHLAWNFASGMETGLFAMLLSGTGLGLAAWLQDEDRTGLRLFVACLALLPVTRPEGIAMVALAAAFALWHGRRHPAVPLLPVLLAALPFALWLLALWLLTGEWKPAGLIAKGLMERPDIGNATRVQIAGETLVAIPLRFYRNIVPDSGYALFKGTDYLPYVPWGLGILALAGGFYAAMMEWRGRRPGPVTLLLAMWLVGLASLTGSALPFIHQQRYLAPWTLPATVLAVVGLRRLAQLFQQHEETALRAGATALAVLSLPSLAFWIPEYGRNARDIYHQHRVMSFGLDGEAAKGERLAVTDTGVLVYYSQIPAVDLVGLTSPQFTRPFGVGESAVLEEMAALTPAARPGSLITYREWFSGTFPLGPARYGAELPETSITSGRFLGRYPILWEDIALGQDPGLAPDEVALASVNVAHLASESRARYAAATSPFDDRRHLWPRPSAPLATTPEGGVEGGRFVRGESFDMIPSDDATTVTLIARLGTTGPGAPLAATARVLELRAMSLDSGLDAAMTFEVPVAEPGACADVRVPLDDLLDRAGGRRWRFTLRAVEPPGAAWLSFRYTLAATRPQEDAP